MVNETKNRIPFSYTIGYSVKVASGSVDTQLVRMPWASPGNRPGLLTFAAISNSFATAGVANIWDQDLSNTTPPTAGSAGAAIFPLEFGASAASGVSSKTTIYTADQLPKKPIVGGLAVQTTQPGVTIMFDVTYI